MQEYWQEIHALTMRWVRRLSREKFSMLFTLVQPMLFWLIFFGNLFQIGRASCRERVLELV